MQFDRRSVLWRRYLFRWIDVHLLVLGWGRLRRMESEMRARL
jgi:hypothetical protein